MRFVTQKYSWCVVDQFSPELTITELRSSLIATAVSMTLQTSFFAGCIEYQLRSYNIL